MHKTSCLVVLLLSAIGCAYPDSPAPQKYQDIVIDAVWRQTYHMEHTAPPQITWVFNTATDEMGHSGFTPSAYQTWVACRFPGTGEGASCNEPVFQTAIAHELNHARCAALTGDPDASHSRCDWKIVDEAKDNLGIEIAKVLTPCLTSAKTDAETNACLF